MLGEKLGEEIGRLTATRVLPARNGAPCVEVSFEAAGTLLEEHATNVGTYVSTARPDGTLFGEGQGIVMTESGALVTWRGQGIGHMLGRGNAVKYRGAIYFSTASEKFARLNGVCGVFEYETDEGGKSENRTYEWI